MGVMYSDEKEAKNLNATGMTTKYPNRTPEIKQKLENRITGSMYLFSFSYRPGATNFHICHSITGAPRIVPEIKDTFI
jgi:hypothetical protein